MKTLLLNNKSRWFTSIFAITVLTAGAFFLLTQQNAAVTPLFPTYTTGNFTFSTPQQLTANYGNFSAADAEPEIKVDLFGNIYVTAIQGVPGGTDFWKSIDKGGSFVYMGQPDGAQDHCQMLPQCVAAGGGDDSIAVSNGGYLYVSSLWLGSVTMSASYDGGTGGVLPGQKWEVNPAAATIPGDDRQWIASYGPQTVYMSYTDIATGVIDFQKSTDAGKTFGAPVQTYPVTSTVLSDVQGNMAVDQYNGNIYICFVPLGADNQVYINRSTDGGSTWTLIQAYNGPAGSSNAQVFPTMAVDRGGNVYVAFSQCGAGHLNCQIQMVGSVDQGTTWQPAFRVSNGAATATAVEPTIAAGSAGIVDVTWLGSAAATPDVASNWHAFFAQVTNANTGSPTIAQNQAETAIMHKWDICFNGLGCANNAHQAPGNRDLLEYYSMAIDSDGNANIAYADSVTNCPDATCITHTFFTKQTAGPSAYVPPAAPAPATFAANLALPGSNNAAEPSVWADSHNCIYGSAPGNPYFWASENAGVSFRDTTVPAALGGGDEDVTTIRQATGARNDALYYADLALADVGIFKSTDRGVTWSSSATPYGQLNASSDRQWISGDRINSNVDQILWEMDHELASEDIRIAASINDSVWGTTSGVVDPELSGTIPNTNPGPIFVNKVTHQAVGVFLASTITTNLGDPPFGKEPHIWSVVATAPAAGGAPPLNVANYPIFKGLIDSPSNALAGTTTYGSHLAAIFPAADADSAGNIYAAWSTLSGRPNASIPPGSNNATTWDIWFASSHDGGKTFYGPFKVSSGVGTSVLPWIAAGDNGRVDIVWYQSSNPTPPLVSDVSTPGQLTGGPNMMPVGSTWTVKFAQSLNAASREPVFAVTTASDHINHTGSISIGGLTGSSDRSLLDYFEVAIGPDGLANILYADNGTAPLHVTYARQNGGPLALTNPSSVTCIPPPPLPTDVVSHKIHGASFVGDIHLLPPNPGIEMRRNTAADVTPAPNAGRDHELIITFPAAVTVSGGVTVTTNNPSDTPTGNIVAGNGTAVITVDLHNIQNVRRVTVTLNGVADTLGHGPGPVPVLMGVLLGDINSNALVNSTDISLTQAQSGKPLSSSNFPTDVNLNGLINSTDISMVQAKSGTGLP